MSRKTGCAGGPRSLNTVEEVFPQDTNTYGTLFGGRLVALMDRSAGLCASRFARVNLVTLAIDSLFFREPIKLAQVVELESRVVYTSEHSLAVQVDVFASDKTDPCRTHACSGTFFFVAKDPRDRTVPIPHFVPVSAQEKKDWKAAEDIRKELLNRFRR